MSKVTFEGREIDFRTWTPPNNPPGWLAEYGSVAWVDDCLYLNHLFFGFGTVEEAKDALEGLGVSWFDTKNPEHLYIAVDQLLGAVEFEERSKKVILAIRDGLDNRRRAGGVH